VFNPPPGVQFHTNMNGPESVVIADRRVKPLLVMSFASLNVPIATSLTDKIF